MQETTFHTNGPLPPDAAHLYVERRSDQVLTRLVNGRDYVAVIEPLCWLN